MNRKNLQTIAVKKNTAEAVDFSASPFRPLADFFKELCDRRNRARLRLLIPPTLVIGDGGRKLYFTDPETGCRPTPCSAALLPGRFPACATIRQPTPPPPLGPRPASGSPGPEPAGRRSNVRRLVGDECDDEAILRAFAASRPAAPPPDEVGPPGGAPYAVAKRASGGGNMVGVLADAAALNAALRSPDGPMVIQRFVKPRGATSNAGTLPLPCAPAPKGGSLAIAQGRALAFTELRGSNRAVAARSPSRRCGRCAHAPRGTKSRRSSCAATGAYPRGTGVAARGRRCGPGRGLGVCWPGRVN